MATQTRRLFIESTEAAIRQSTAESVPESLLRNWRGNLELWIQQVREVRAQSPARAAIYSTALVWLRDRLQDDLPRTDFPEGLTGEFFRPLRSRYLALAREIESLQSADSRETREQLTRQVLRIQVARWDGFSPIRLHTELELVELAQAVGVDDAALNSLILSLPINTDALLYARINTGAIELSTRPQANAEHWVLLANYRATNTPSRLRSAAASRSGTEILPGARSGSLSYPVAHVPTVPEYATALQDAFGPQSQVQVERVVRLIDHPAFSHRVDLRLTPPSGAALSYAIYINLNRLEVGDLGRMMIGMEHRQRALLHQGQVVRGLLHFYSSHLRAEQDRQRAQALLRLQEALTPSGASIELAYAEQMVIPSQLRIWRPGRGQHSLVYPMPALVAFNAVPLAALDPLATESLLAAGVVWDHPTLIQALSDRLTEELEIAAAQPDWEHFVSSAFIPFAYDWILLPSEMQAAALRELDQPSRDQWARVLLAQHQWRRGDVATAR